MRKKRFLILDRIVFWLITWMIVMPSFLSAYTAIDVLAAEIGTFQTSLPMDDGTASATGTINGSGTAVDWVVTVTKFDSDDERAPKLELEYSSGLGTPYNISTNVQQISRPDMGAVTVLKGHTYSAAAETLTMTFTTDITDPISETVSIKMLAATVNEEESGTVNIFGSGNTKILSLVNPIAKAAAEAAAQAEAEAAAQAEAEAAAQSEAEAAAQAEAEAAAQAEAEAAAQAAAEAAAQAEAEVAAQVEAEAAAQAEAEAAAQAEAEAAAQAEAEAAAQEDAEAEAAAQAEAEAPPINEVEKEIEDDSSAESSVSESSEMEVSGQETDNSDSEIVENITNSNEPSEDEKGNSEEMGEQNDYSESPINFSTFGIKSAKLSFDTLGEIGTYSLDGSVGSTNIVDPSTLDNELEPGEVKITKSATPVEGKVNTWDITLRVVGRDKSVTSDIVLVIDRSGSMDSFNRMQDAKNAAKLFVETVLDADPVNTRIAIVSFAREVTTDRAFTNDETLLDSTIDSLDASGGTLTQGGVKQARDLIAGSAATKKTIILLSDGAPTYSYAINSLTRPTDFVRFNQRKDRNNSWNSSAVNFGIVEYASRSDLLTTKYSYSTRVGYGNAPYTRAFWDYNNYYYSHGNSAIAEAGYAKAAGNSLYTISLSAGVDGTATLQAMASPGRAYASDNSGLSSIFQQIAGQLGSAVSAAEVTDPMASGFIINDLSSIVATSGATPFDDLTDTLSWTFNSLTQVLPGYTDIKYEELTYRIEISETTPTNATNYPTNGATPISFYDIDGSYATNYFQVPEVDPVFVTIDKILLDVNNNPKSSTDSFTINLSMVAFSQDETLTPDDPVVVLKQVWDVGTYTISESASIPSDRYTSSIVVNGETKNTIDLVIDGTDQNIVVTNREATTEITANKLWYGGPATKPDVWFKLYRQAGSEGSVEPVPETEATIKTLTGGMIGGTLEPVTTVTWENLTKYDSQGTAYIFSVKEVDSSGIDYVPDSYVKAEDGLTVTNTFKPSLVLTKVDSDGETPLIGAKFVIYKGDESGPSGDPIQPEQTTDAAGKATFAALEDGTYWIAETQPPSGYNWLSEPIGPFVVAEGVITGPEAYTPTQQMDETTGQFTGNYGITVENRPLTELPQAGGFGIFPFIGLGIGLMALGIFTEKRNKKRGKVEEEKKMGKMSRFISRIVSFLMVLTVVLPVMASATELNSIAPVGPPKPPATTAVTIHKIVGTNNFTLQDHDGSLLEPADITALWTGAVENNNGVIFSVWKLKDITGVVTLADGLDGTEKDDIKVMTDAQLINNFGTPTPVTAGPLGTTDFGTGYYFVKETTKPATLVTQIGVPFFMELPALESMYDDYRDTYLTALHIYPKNVIESDMPVIDKDVLPREANADPSDHASFDMGEDFYYMIYPKVPKGIEDYTLFKVSDTLDTQLTYLDTVTVSYNGVPFNSPADYTLDTILVGGVTRGFSVTFTPDGLDKLATNRRLTSESDRDLVIKFKAEINSTAGMGTEILNNATLDYNNGYITNTQIDVDDNKQPEVHTGGRQFVKVDNATGKPTTALQDAKFVIKRNSDGKYMTNVNGQISWKTSAAPKDDADVTKLSINATTGEFEVKGLAYSNDGLTSGYYTLEEVVTPNGYVTMNPVEFEINASSYLDDNFLTIKNVKRPMIPQTGGMGTVLFTVAGLAMMTVAVVALKKKEEA